MFCGSPSRRSFPSLLSPIPSDFEECLAALLFFPFFFDVSAQLKRLGSLFPLFRVLFFLPPLRLFSLFPEGGQSVSFNCAGMGVTGRNCTTSFFPSLPSFFLSVNGSFLRTPSPPFFFAEPQVWCSLFAFSFCFFLSRAVPRFLMKPFCWRPLVTSPRTVPRVFPPPPLPFLMKELNDYFALFSFSPPLPGRD